MQYFNTNSFTRYQQPSCILLEKWNLSKLTSKVFAELSKTACPTDNLKKNDDFAGTDSFKTFKFCLNKPSYVMQNSAILNISF